MPQDTLRVGLITNKDLLIAMKHFKDCDCEIIHNKEAGTLEIYNKSKELILRAIQKGNDQAPWIILRVKQ